MTVDAIILLDDPAARDAAVAGEKAAALARMRQSGLPVPAGFVVPAATFEEATRDLDTHIDASLAGASDGMVALDEASRAVRELIVGLPLAPPLRDAVAEAYERLSGGAPVAVRSSGTAEDLPGASFAGQYDSYLNVSGADAVISRLVDVWASLYSTHAISYRERQDVPHSAARMAVLVQRQLPADAAGVLFTRDPVTGATDRMIINVALGLGEGVVAGEAPADSFALDGESLAVVERTVADKDTMVAPAPSGGIEQRDVPAERRAEPALSDAELSALGRLAQAVRELEGGDRDIEFAVVDGEVQLLQARPVTGLNDSEPGDEFPVAWEDPTDEQHSWLLMTGFETPKPLMRFEEDVRRASAVHQRRVFEDTGVPMAQNHILRFVNGYLYARSPNVAEDEVAKRQREHEARGRAYAERGENYYVVKIEPETLATLEGLGPFRRPAGESLESRFRFLETALEASSHVMGDLHWRMAGAGTTGASGEWPQVFQELTGEPPSDAAVMLQAVDNKTTRLVSRLRRLARLVQADADLRAVFRDRAYDRLAQAPLRSRPAIRRFRARFRSLLREYGRRSGRSYGSVTSFATATWNLDHRVPLDLVAAYAQQDLDELDRLEAEARRERRAVTRRVRRRLAAQPERLARFDLALRVAHDGLRNMENHNHVMEQGVAGVLREAIWWLGRGFVRDGRLDRPDDAMHLSLDELRVAARGEGDLRPLVQERAAEFERRSRMHPPRFLGEGDRTANAGPPGSRDVPPPLDAGTDGAVLRGRAASRGRYTGPARVVTPGGERPAVGRGDILVARNAGQDWTPLLPLLGGIVLDEGELFQHAALIAREYRVPAVIQTRAGTTAIADGQRITIDGDAGVVELTPDGG